VLSSKSISKALSLPSCIEALRAIEKFHLFVCFVFNYDERKLISLMGNVKCLPPPALSVVVKSLISSLFFGREKLKTFFLAVIIARVNS
jgi:hypothetical protein